MKYFNGIMTDFSIGQSLLTVDKLIKTAGELGIKKLIVADDMTISSMLSVQGKAKGAEIEAMCGIKFRCYENPTYRKEKGQPAIENPFKSVKIFPKNENGLKSIFKILTIANEGDRYYYNARGDINDLAQLRDCVVTPGDVFGFHAPSELKQILDLLDPSNSFYNELVCVNTPYWRRFNADRLSFSDPRVKGWVASRPVMAKDENECKTLPVLRAICSNVKVDRDDIVSPINLLYAMDRESIDEGCDVLTKAFPDKADIIEQAKAGIEFNSEPFYVFEKHEPCLPKMADNEFETLVRYCMEGFKTRLGKPHMGYQPAKEDLPKYFERLKYELSVIKKLGFSRYFLVVRDLVIWSKTNGVRMGCARGSGGGSLIAFLTGITEVDPLRFNLIFERFINPERLDLPDIDLDYQSTKRNLVIKYLTEKYGTDRVAGITNYGTLASASAFRDAGRVFELTPQEMDATKLVPKDAGFSFTLTQAAEAVPEIEKLKETYPEVWSHALNLEGVMRSLGQHAAGVVVAGEPLINRAVVEHRAEGNVVNWDKRVVEDWGLIKMDVLGLSTLDVLDLAQDYIKQRHGIDVDYLALPLDDEKVLDAFGRGDTTAVFQFDSQGMQSLLKRLAKNERLTFDDVTAATALYRPGPLDSGLTDEYVAIKQGLQSPYYEHPNMKEALKSTYGVMVYQEQIMQVSRDLAGFTMAEADMLRKAIGKKDHEKMHKMRDKFISGCESVSGMIESKSALLWDKIEKFASYSFNLSHACAYSVLSYWTCWLKVYYPAEYFAAQLSIVGEDKYPALIRNARSAGVAVLPPDVNFSGVWYGIKSDNEIVMPFSAIKGCSEKTSEKILALREKVGGRFESMQQFADLASEKGSGVNKRVVENLNKVGAFADIEPSQPKASDESRKLDQIELMPGLIVDTVVSKRTTVVTEERKNEILTIANDIITCKNCDFTGKPHILPLVGGSKCRYMFVFDYPSSEEEKLGKLMSGSVGKWVRKALKDAGVSFSQGYFTTLVKSRKMEKYLTNSQINGCSQWLEKEIEILKPGVIVCMGSASTKHLLPSLKMPANEVGNAFYDPKRKVSIIVGLNPNQLFFVPEKIKLLDKICGTLSDVLGLD